MTNFAFVRKTVNEQFVKKFGLHLRKVRMEKNISMQTLAYMTNVEYSQISRIEHGKINTSIGMLYELALALDVKVTVLLDFEM
jgi:transcriptional regulator with XRE-family HTH domain